ncbi:MAG: hypothetical protein D3909_10155 [Candidatus Electrothrix sp. ATG1]|nr:hypothetical protein [Candidatus Electrothrix sp. ATG1]MCI5210115.1 hypothetical protein [Candidatus Electrothrix sp. ATG2]
MISHHFKCIFIHQRKNAGSSIISSFGITPEQKEWHIFNDGVLSENPDWKEKLSFYNDYFVFSVIRNPWDRFISGWKYCESTRNKELIDVINDLPKTGHDYRHLTRPQIEILLDKDGKLITDYLIRFERLQDDFDIVCDRIGKPRYNLPKKNATQHDHYTSYFRDTDILSRFESHFTKDINFFKSTLNP